MSDSQMHRRVCFEGRECDVIFAYVYYADDYFDIWLMDVETEKFTSVCTITDPDLPYIEQQRLVREEFVELLAEAGIVQPTGEVVETERYGRLHTCGVPLLEREQKPSAVSPSNRPELIEHDTLERYLDDDRRLLGLLFVREKPAASQPDRDELQIERDLDDEIEL
jgi:hypothetical protein